MGKLRSCFSKFCFSTACYILTSCSLAFRSISIVSTFRYGKGYKCRFSLSLTSSQITTENQHYHPRARYKLEEQPQNRSPWRLFSRTTSFRPSFAALSELVDSQLIEIVPVRQKSGLNFCWNDFIDKLYSTTQRLKSKLDSVGGTFFVCHFDRFLSLRKSPGNTVIDVDISVSAKAAREVTVRTTDIFALTLFWQHIFTGFSFQWCFVVHFLS